jgi:putative flippase GtrA
MDRKIVGGATGGGLTALLIWILSMLGLNVPAEAASIITGVIATLFGYFTMRAAVEPSDPEPAE